MKAHSFPVQSFIGGIFLMLTVLLLEVFFKLPVGTAAYVLVSLIILSHVRTPGLVVYTGIIASFFLLIFFSFSIFSSGANRTFIANRIISVSVIWVAVLLTLRSLKIPKKATEEKHESNASRKTLEKMKELDVMKSKFITMTSHEFRTPLTTILSSAFLLENYTGAQYELEKKKHLDRIKRSVHGLTELLHDFLLLDKLEKGIVQVSLKPVFLKRFGEELLQEVSLIKKEDQRIIYEFDGNDTEVLIDKHLIRNILLILLSNAIKFSSISGIIYMRISVNSKRIRLGVSDEGIGVPFEDQKFLFKRFFRANNASDIQGTGLGLNIVKRYVKLLNGQIDFQSWLNKGTVVNITLPLEQVTELHPNIKTIPL